MNKRLNVKMLTKVSLFASLIAVGAFIKIPIPNLPFTLQFFFTTMAGTLLGPYYGALAVGIYLFTGLIGIPIFTQGGGPSYVLQPTFGYLVGFMVGAFVCGYMVHNLRFRSFKGITLAVFVNLLIVYVFGMAYFYIMSNYVLNIPISPYNLFLYCFLLAIPGDIVLSITASATTVKMFKAGVIKDEVNIYNRY